MGHKNLQEVIDAKGSAVELLRNSQIGSYIYPVVPADFQNWIKEQRAWRETADRRQRQRRARRRHLRLRAGRA